MFDKSSYLTLAFLLKALLTGIFFIYYTDYLAYTALGLYVSAVLALAAIIMAFFDYRRALHYSFIIIFMSARVPRDLVLVMTDLKLTREVVFHSIAATTIASFSLAQWIMISLGVIAVLKLFRHGLSYRFNGRLINLMILYLFVMITMYLATVIDLMTSRDIFDIKEFLSDQRYFIISFCGIFAAIYYSKLEPAFFGKLTSILVFIGIASGLRSIGFAIMDMAMGKINLSFAGQAYLLAAVFYAFIYTYSRQFGIFKTVLLSFIIFAGAFNISRMDIMLIFFDGLFLLLLIMYSNLQFKHKLRNFAVTMIIFVLMVIIPPIILYNINSSIYHFLVYKLEFFTKEIWSGEFTSSPAVRLYEFNNIVRDFVDSVYPLFIGRGFGAYFIDWHVPIGIPIGLFDYSKEQLMLGRFFKPHTFFNFLFLKGGILMIWLYVYLIWLQVKIAKQLLWEKNKDIIMLASFTIFFFPWAFNIFWRPPFIFLFSFLFIVLIHTHDKVTTDKIEEAVI
jgi:hypothetical protein